jgi:hypothetical protein
VADLLVPNRVGAFLENLKTGVLEKGLLSKACKNLSRRRFKEFENAPLAADETASALDSAATIA